MKDSSARLRFAAAERATGNRPCGRAVVVAYGNVLRRKENAVPRLVVRLVVLAMMLFALAAAPALADVHGVSNAECAAGDAPSGASADASRAAPGRPDAPIPVSASDRRTQGRGNEADAQGVNC